MSDMPTIILDDESTPMAHLLVDVVIHSFQRGVDSQEQADTVICDGRVISLGEQVDALLQDNAVLQDELIRVSHARERAHQCMSAKIQRQKNQIRTMHGAEGTREAVAKARVDERERICEFLDDEGQSVFSLFDLSTGRSVWGDEIRKALAPKCVKQ